MLGIMLAPVSPLVENHNSQLTLSITENIAHAQTTITPDTQNTTLWGETGSCGFTNIIGCVEQIIYFFFVVVPSFFLVIVAKFFNMIASMTLADEMYRADFISKIWKIIRDFSNIFFILILLYAAFQVILGLGHGGGKKIVAGVIMVALMVNFSLFISKIVIDSSNVLALIFYNKIDCKQADGKPCKVEGEDLPTSKTNVPEKNLAGALISRFEINSFLNGKFLNDLKSNPENLGAWGQKLSTGLTIGLSMVYGIVIYALVWALLKTALSFLGRMIMLMLLMMVSPLAFVTAAVPKFRKTDTIGFDSWMGKLIETSFVASVFMAILYIVSEIINADVFTAHSANESSLGVTSKLILIFVPALLIVVLLKKGASYAQEASGQFTGMVMGMAKLIGGAGLMVGTAGLAMAGRRVIGGGGGWAANKLASGAEKIGLKGVGTKLRDFGDFARRSSFDLRGVKVMGKGLSSTGLRVGEAQKGGWNEMKKKQVEKRQKRAEQLEKRGTGNEKKSVENAEIALKEATLPVKLDLENADKEIDKARKELSDEKLADDAIGSNAANIAAAKGRLDAAKASKELIRTTAGLPALERVVNRAKQDLIVAEEKITTAYAESISSTGSKIFGSIRKLGGYSWDGADEASRKIRSGTKLDSGEKPH